VTEIWAGVLGEFEGMLVGNSFETFGPRLWKVHNRIADI
jgi:hypothetical protein